MGQVYSHLSEEERQVVRIEMGNGASVRRMAMMPGRHASTAGREIRRDTWFPSDESESCRPRRLRTGPWTGRCYVAGPARRRAMRREAPAPGPVARRRRRRKAGGGRAGRGRVPLRTSICECPYGQDDGSRFGAWGPTASSARGCSRHAELRDEPGMATYFADPHSSWRRGGNENRNGMIRRYPPKRTPIAPSMARELLESAANKDVALTNR